MDVLTRIVFTVILWASTFSELDADDGETCNTPQYAELGRRTTIHCTFKGNFHGVYWYNTTDVVHEEPIMLLQGSVKRGKGFASGEFDMHPNGSLIIKNVSQIKDQDFAVVNLGAPSEDPRPFIIHVIVTVRSPIPFPSIDRCDTDSRLCVAKVQPNTQISCVVQDVRPAVTLLWQRRTYGNDVNLSYEISTISHNDIHYKTVISTLDTFGYSQSFELLICKAHAPPKVLEKQESFILLQNYELDLFSRNTISILVELYSKMEFACTKLPFGFLTWKKLNQITQSFEDIVIAILLRETFVRTNSDNFELGVGGSLVSPNVSVENEGKYACVYGNGFVDGVTLFDVTVYVKPTSVNPVILGCQPKRYCELNVGTKGRLTCTVEGIRPEIDLMWEILNFESAGFTFSNHVTKVNSNKETFRVSITTDYAIRYVSEISRITIECKIAGKYGFLFNSTAKADLLFLKVKVSPTVSNSDGSSNERLPWIMVTIASSVLLIILGLLAVSTCYKKGKKCTNKSREVAGDEQIQMLEGNSLSQPMEEKKDQFVNELRGKYEALCETIQPVPYIRDRRFCVNNVYVEGGIDLLLYNKNGKDVWERIDSYHNILSDYRLKSPRKIVEGDAGYGKTILTLQFAYDWCQRVEGSALLGVEIFILLRLRQLGGVTSIYKAIKQFLLSKDCSLSEDDVEAIIQNSPSETVLVVLDGFDEYPDEDLQQETDIVSIIRRDMFRQIPVILTTRSSCIPHDIAVNARRIRLTGFDELARDTYICKAVVGTDTAAALRIKESLKDNPVLADVCQVPLFFVMFAHMTHESNEFKYFQSVTSFFTYMVDCFHLHLHKKDKTKQEIYEKFFEEHEKFFAEALNSLSGPNKRNVWRKETLIKLLGREFYEYHVQVGVLVEQEVLEFSRQNGSKSLYKQLYRTDVGFYHKLFCEWYAAHSLSDMAAKSFSSLEKVLPKMDPFELHYLYRFACGLNKDAAKNILRYLDGVEESEQFKYLCILEQKGNVDNIKNQVETLCSDTIIISCDDSQLKQRSTIELLEIASSNRIQIRCVQLENCIKAVDLQNWNLNLMSGIGFTNLYSVQEIIVTEMGREIPTEEARNIILFSFHCFGLRILRFMCCLLPPLIEVFPSESDVMNKNIKGHLCVCIPH